MQRWTAARRARAESMFCAAINDCYNQARRLAPVYALLEWKWRHTVGVPTHEQIQSALRRTILSVKAKVLSEEERILPFYRLSSGGLYVHWEIEELELVLRTGFIDEFERSEGSNRLGRWDDTTSETVADRTLRTTGGAGD